MRKQVCGMGIGDEIEMWSLVRPPGVQARFPVEMPSSHLAREGSLDRVISCLPPLQPELAVHSTFGLHQDAHSFLEPRTMTRYFGERFTFQSNIPYVVGHY